MRNVKLRAWDHQEKRMIIDEQDFIPLKVTNKGILRLNPNHTENLWSIVGGERFELMQFIGLTDCNDVEIYEGDLGERDGIIYQVVWIEGSASYGVKVIKTDSVLTKGLTFPIQQYVLSGLKCEFLVIGNIYEVKETFNQ